MLRTLTLSSSLLAALAFLAPAANDAPAYTVKGDLAIPAAYREWIFLTSGIDMTYNVAAKAQPATHSTFDNVFVNTSSYREFLRTGTWPDKTTFILELRGADNPVSINRAGHTQSADVHSMEIHVKDRGQWAFYERNADTTSAHLIPKPASCYTCHEQHAVVDTTFVQFYPTLLPTARAKHTLAPFADRELAAPGTPVQ